MKKALPLLRLGLMILQIGLLSTGVPIPIAGMANSALDRADKLSFLKSAAGLLQDDVSMDAVGSSLDSMEAKRRTNSTEQFETLRVVKIASRSELPPRSLPCFWTPKIPFESTSG